MTFMPSLPRPSAANSGGSTRALSPGPAGPIPGAAQRREFGRDGAGARALQRFLTDWDDDAVIARLQEYLGPRLEHPLAVWVFDGSDFPKQGVKSVGVTRQYCGALGKVANCQAGVFLAHVGPRGRALVDKRLYLPESWTSDPARCATAGVPEVPGEDRPGPGDAAPSTGVSQSAGDDLCRGSERTGSARTLLPRTPYSPRTRSV